MLYRKYQRRLVRCGTGHSPRVGVYKRSYVRFKADRDLIYALMHLRKRIAAGERGGATDGELALVTFV